MKNALTAYEQLSFYFEKCDILSHHQFGFKQNCSTSNAVRQLYDELCDNMDNNKHTCPILLDLKKAYDTVNQGILLKKLEKYGVRGLPLKLFQSYGYPDKTQYTMINKVKSNVHPVTCGVPQGSTLGPIFFSIYFNDMPTVSNFNVKLFTDDTVLTLTDTNIANLKNRANSEIIKIDSWPKINKLSLDYTKTKLMLIA